MKSRALTPHHGTLVRKSKGGSHYATLKIDEAKFSSDSLLDIIYSNSVRMQIIYFTSTRQESAVLCSGVDTFWSNVAK